MTAPTIITYRLIKTTNRLTFDIITQLSTTMWLGDDTGQYKFTASNGYEVVSRSRMDIQTDRIWVLGAAAPDVARSGTMVFASNNKRDSAYEQFVIALNEWAASYGGIAVDADKVVQSKREASETTQQWANSMREIVEGCKASILAAIDKLPQFQDQPSGDNQWQVWWGIGLTNKYPALFNSVAEAQDFAATIKSNTVVRSSKWQENITEREKMLAIMADMNDLADKSGLWPGWPGTYKFAASALATLKRLENK